MFGLCVDKIEADDVSEQNEPQFAKCISNDFHNSCGEESMAICHLNQVEHFHIQT